MLYAKIDTNGNVTEFPYRLDDPFRLPIANQEIPEDAVEVDTETYKPSTNWDQNANYDTIVVEDGKYLLTYTVSDRVYASAEAKVKALKALHKNLSQRNLKRFETQVKKTVEEYNELERESWFIQVEEANKYTADNIEPTPLLSKLAEMRGETLQHVVDRVLAKDAAFRTAYGELLGRYQSNVKKLELVNFEDDTTWSNINLVEIL